MEPKNLPYGLSKSIDFYRDRNGIRIWYGLGEYACDNFTRPMIIVDFSWRTFNRITKDRMSAWGLDRIYIYGGIGEAGDIAPLMADYEYCDAERLLRSFKVAHRWFLKRARRLRYFDEPLETFLRPDGYTLDIDKAHEKYEILNNERVLQINTLRQV